MSLFDPQNAPKSSVFDRKMPDSGQKPPETDDIAADVDIETLDLDSELVKVYAKAQKLLDTIVGSVDVPANQQAQVFNSVVTMLDRLAKMRTDVYNAERLRKLEQSLIRTLQAYPQELQEAFLRDYERSLSESEQS